MKSEIIELNSFGHEFKNNVIINKIFTNAIELLKQKGTLVESDLPALVLTMVNLDDYLTSLIEKNIIQKNFNKDILSKKLMLLKEKKSLLENELEELEIVKKIALNQTSLINEDGLLMNNNSINQFNTTLKLTLDIKEKIEKLDEKINALEFKINNNLIFHIYNEQTELFKLDKEFNLTTHALLEAFSKNGLTALSRSKIEDTINSNVTINLFEGMFEED